MRDLNLGGARTRRDVSRIGVASSLTVTDSAF